VIGMKHDDHIRARRQSLAITGLLVAAITVIAVMLKNLQAKPARQINGTIGTAVVHQNANIYEIRKFAHRDRERFLRVVSGHNDRNAFTINHYVTFMIPEK